jgi:hypothetical protein
MSDHTAVFVRPTGGQHRRKLHQATKQINKLHAWFVKDSRGNPRRNWRDGTYEVRSAMDKNLPAIKFLLQLTGFRIIREEAIPDTPAVSTNTTTAPALVLLA